MYRRVSEYRKVLALAWGLVRQKMKTFSTPRCRNIQ
jgi:hypothetical protein